MPQRASTTTKRPDEDPQVQCIKQPENVLVIRVEDEDGDENSAPEQGCPLMDTDDRPNTLKPRSGTCSIRSTRRRDEAGYGRTVSQGRASP
jgi:hypothetical protein